MEHCCGMQSRSSAGDHHVFGADGGPMADECGVVLRGVSGLAGCHHYAETSMRSCCHVFPRARWGVRLARLHCLTRRYRCKGVAWRGRTRRARWERGREALTFVAAAALRSCR